MSLAVILAAVSGSAGGEVSLGYGVLALYESRIIVVIAVACSYVILADRRSVGGCSRKLDVQLVALNIVAAYLIGQRCDVGLMLLSSAVMVISALLILNFAPEKLIS